MAFVNDTDLAATGAGQGAYMVGFAQSATGAAQRSAMVKLREIVSITDFGGRGDGVTDNSAALLAALLTNKTVFFPATENGTPYLVSGNFDFASIKATTATEIPVVSLIGEGIGRSVIQFTGAGSFLKGGTTTASGGYPQALVLRDLSLRGTGVRGSSLAVTYGQFTTTAGNGYAGCNSTQVAVEWEFEPASAIENCAIENFGTGILTKQGYGYTIATSHIRYNMIGLDLRAATTTGNIVGNTIERNGIGIGLWIASLINFRSNAIQGNYAGADIVSYNWNTQIKFDGNYFEASPKCFVQDGDSGGEYTSNNFVFVDNKGLDAHIANFANRFYFIRNRMGEFYLGSNNERIVVEDNTVNDDDGLTPFTNYTGPGVTGLIYRDAPIKHVQAYAAAGGTPNGASDSFNVVIAGAKPGDQVIVTHSALPAGWETAGNCIANDTVRVDLLNFSGAAGTSFTGTLKVLVERI